MNQRDPRQGMPARPVRQGRPQGPSPRRPVPDTGRPAAQRSTPFDGPYRADDMPLLTHDETGAASVANARARQQAPVALEERTVVTSGGGGRPPAGGRTRPTKKKRRWLRWVLALIGLMIVAPFVAFAIGWAIFKVPTANDAALVQVATFTFADGPPVATIRPEQNNSQINRKIVPLDQVPQETRKAVLAAEDSTFYSNPGFDLSGIVYAVFKQLTGGNGGGSTITQQYIKVSTGNDQASGVSGLWRKYREIVVAVKISREQTKDQILENYLNTIYLGRGASGIQAAAQAYFGKDVGQLTVAEGAYLAGTIQSPSNTDVDRTRTRWNYVLDQMVKDGSLSAADRAQQVFPTPIDKQPVQGGVPDDDRYHIYDKAKAELNTLGITDDQISTEGLTVTTTIDSRTQKEAVDAVARTMDGLPKLRSALAAVDPKTGAIVAYYGGSQGLGTDYADDAQNPGRQPGSSFKPFVLAAALQTGKGIGLGSLYDGSNNQTFPGKATPVRNSEGDSCDMCNLKVAMTKSINTVFYALAVQIGPANVVKAAHQAGIPDTQLNAQVSGGIALGDQEVHPLDMASAYGTFAADGVHHDPFMVSKVVASDGRVLYDRANVAAQSTQALPQQVACNVTNSLTDVARSSTIMPSGVSTVAAKTGTVQLGDTNDNKDTWTVGYTPSLSTAVWVGTDLSDPVRTKAGRPAYGRTLAGAIWRDFTSAALKGQPNEQFSPCEAMGTPIQTYSDDGNGDNGGDSANNDDNNGDNGDDGDNGGDKKKRDNGDNDSDDGFFTGTGPTAEPVSRSTPRPPAAVPAVADGPAPDAPGSPAQAAGRQAAQQREARRQAGATPPPAPPTG